MPLSEDWLQDPLEEIRRNIGSTGDEWRRKWGSFHFSTRIKLEGADFFYRQALGAASISDEVGFPLLAHRQTEWYMSAFLFELMSAYATLLQELNALYSNLDVKDVRFDNIKDELPGTIREIMSEVRGKTWFKELQQHRNRGAHHSYIPKDTMIVGFGDRPWDKYSQDYQVNIQYIDKDGNLNRKDIKAFSQYLSDMINHINEVWKQLVGKLS